MFSSFSQLTSAEEAFLVDWAVDFDSASTLDDKTQVSIDYEDDAVGSSTLTSDEKERVLYMISSMKHAYHFSRTTGTTIDFDKAVDYLFDIMGYDDLDNNQEVAACECKF